MENNLENLTIGVFAKAADVNVETIRFYQRKGLLPEPDKPYGSIRRYGGADVVRVKFVKSAQRLGFSLDEMAALARMEAVLSELVCACRSRQGNVSCPLIASLQGGVSLPGSAIA